MWGRSLSTRFIVTAVIAVALSFSLFIGLVYNRLEHSLATQSRALERISSDNLSDVLTADLGLAAARLHYLFADTERRVQATAARSDATEVIRSRNVVAIAEVLGPAAADANVDAMAVVDLDLNIIAGSSDQMDFVAVDRAIKESALRSQFETAMAAETGDGRLAVVVGDQLAPLMPPPVTPIVQFVYLVPIRDDFGEVTGAIIAQRWLRPAEKTLAEFSSITDTGIGVYAGGKLIGSVGTDFVTDIATVPETSIEGARDQGYIARCGPALERLEICALKPIEALYLAQHQLTEIGNAEGLRLVRWLGAVGLGSSILLIVLLFLTARPITGPLRRLAGTVGDIASGVYDTEVEGTERQDEVGAIARAVALLNKSVKEIDQLRKNIVAQHDILERREIELRTQNRLFDAALNNMSHGLCMFDEQRRLIVSNRTYEQIFGFERGDIIPGMHWEEIRALEKGASDDPDDRSSNEVSVDLGKSESRSANIRLSDGRTILCTRQPLLGGGWVGIYEDVTESQLAREKLLHMTRHDFLTGLPNRVALREHLEEKLRQQANGGMGFAVLCLDLDEFKTINDTFGHPAGDALLCSVARRLSAAMAGGELVARLGGDEFAIVTGRYTDASTIGERCTTLIETIGAPHQLEDHEAVIGVSIGVAMVTAAGGDPDAPMMEADLALYRAKLEGRNTYRFFEKGMEKAVKARHDLITDLREAIEKQELVAYFQPQLSLATNSISGFEALMRWQSPRRGMVSANEFIPVAEETGLIIPMGEWILRKATSVAARWPAAIKVAVNLSARQLQNPNFVETVRCILDDSGLASDRLELEITESVLLQDDEQTTTQLTELKKLGIRISLDDFGTGYSSLSCLRSFPFDKLKIDQSFVRAMLLSDEARSIVIAIINLADDLRIETTAEGVENEDLFNLLCRSGCTELQGYFIGRPEPELATFVRLADAVPSRTHLGALKVG